MPVHSNGLEMTNGIAAEFCNRLATSPGSGEKLIPHDKMCQKYLHYKYQVFGSVKLFRIFPYLKYSVFSSLEEVFHRQLGKLWLTCSESAGRGVPGLSVLAAG